MLLFIFSSKKSLFHSLFFFFSFLSIFIFFENKIMENPGNKMIIANDPSQKEFIISRSFQKLTILHVILVPYMKTN